MVNRAVPLLLLLSVPLLESVLLSEEQDHGRSYMNPVVAILSQRSQPRITSADIFCFANRPIDYCHQADWTDYCGTGLERQLQNRANFDFTQLAAFLDQGSTNQVLAHRLIYGSPEPELMVRGVLFTRSGVCYDFGLIHPKVLRLRSWDPFPTIGLYVLAEAPLLAVSTPRLRDLYRQVRITGPTVVTGGVYRTRVNHRWERVPELTPPLRPLTPPVPGDVVFFSNGPEYNAGSSYVSPGPPRARVVVPRERILAFLGSWKECRTLSREDTMALWRERARSKENRPPVTRDGELATREKQVVFWELLDDGMLFLEEEDGASCLLLKGPIFEGKRISTPDAGPSPETPATTTTNSTR